MFLMTHDLSQANAKITYINLFKEDHNYYISLKAEITKDGQKSYILIPKIDTGFSDNCIDITLGKELLGEEKTFAELTVSAIAGKYNMRVMPVSIDYLNKKFKTNYNPPQDIDQIFFIEKQGEDDNEQRGFGKSK